MKNTHTHTHTHKYVEVCTRFSSYLGDYRPCAGGLSAVNTFGTQLRDLVKVAADPVSVDGTYGCRRGKRESPRVTTRLMIDDSAWGE